MVAMGRRYLTSPGQARGRITPGRPGRGDAEAAGTGRRIIRIAVTPRPAEQAS